MSVLFLGDVVTTPWPISYSGYLPVDDEPSVHHRHRVVTPVETIAFGRVSKLAHDRVHVTYHAQPLIIDGWPKLSLREGSQDTFPYSQVKKISNPQDDWARHATWFLKP